MFHPCTGFHPPQLEWCLHNEGFWKKHWLTARRCHLLSPRLHPGSRNCPQTCFSCCRRPSGCPRNPPGFKSLATIPIPPLGSSFPGLVALNDPMWVPSERMVPQTTTPSRTSASSSTFCLDCSRHSLVTSVNHWCHVFRKGCSAVCNFTCAMTSKHEGTPYVQDCPNMRVTI